MEYWDNRIDNLLLILVMAGCLLFVSYVPYGTAELPINIKYENMTKINRIGADIGNQGKIKTLEKEMLKHEALFNKTRSEGQKHKNNSMKAARSIIMEMCGGIRKGQRIQLHEGKYGIIHDIGVRLTYQDETRQQLNVEGQIQLLVHDAEGKPISDKPIGKSPQEIIDIIEYFKNKNDEPTGKLKKVL